MAKAGKNHDGSDSKLWKAMACETPVVAYAAGGLTDVVADHETGLLEPESGSVSGLARLLQWMWQHPAERQAMGVAGRRRVIAHFTDELMARRYSELYGQLLSGWRREQADLGNR